MNLIHAYIKLEDTFSGAKDHRIKSVSQSTFDLMLKGVGTTFSHFDKVAAIHSNWKVLEVRQATSEDYAISRTKEFTNTQI